MNTAVATSDIIGGVIALGETAPTGIDIMRLVRRGLPVSTIEFVIETGRLTLAEIDRIVLPRKTLTNRRRLGRLTPEQSDRLVRVARLIAVAEETFGSQEKANIWLRRPTTAAGGEAPLDLLDTDEGARQA
jgi:putative toxin-antitoxin system antitoxin component (TIGR02293 family)